MENIQKYENYISYDWWTNIDRRSIDGWLQNFENNEDVGKLILDNIIFYSDEQMKSYTLNIINQLKAELYEREKKSLGEEYRDDDYFNKKWEEYLKTVKVIPADSENEAGGSPHLVARKYRPFLERKTTAKVDSIQEEIKKGVKEFIFVDDFAGTGKQMIDFLSTLITIEGKEVPIGNLMEFLPEIKVSIGVYVIHRKALERISKKFKKVTIRYVDLIDDKLNLLNEKSIMYHGKNEREVQYVVEYLTNIRRQLIAEQPDYQKLAEYELHIPIVFEHGCPNNTFLPLYARTEKWKQLFKRGDER